MERSIPGRGGRRWLWQAPRPLEGIDLDVTSRLPACAASADHFASTDDAGVEHAAAGVHPLPGTRDGSTAARLR